MATETNSKGMKVERVFSTAGVDPYSTVKWSKRDTSIKGEDGGIIFEQKGCNFPENYSDTAVKVVASKYFHGDAANGYDPYSRGRENSLTQLIDRVVDTIAGWGYEDGYFASQGDADAFQDELKTLCLHQYGAFNSPVWFNVGLYHKYGITGPANNWRWDASKGEAIQVTNAYEYPQGSACFIQGVQDDMQSIMDLAKSEAMLFKFGSGTGTDLSTIRSSKEKLSGGGKPSGPVSFMRVYDSIAGIVKSGGVTRRAAKMQTLKDWHPDIVEFVECKTKEERKALALIAMGYESNFNGEAYSSVCFQNANLSVRLSDRFLENVKLDDEWTTRAVKDGSPVDTFPARDLADKIAQCAWECGDPGVQYEDTIQAWHTCKNTSPINSSNPCSEFMFLDDTSCNLASINLMKFRNEDGSFDVDRFRAACRIFITAQEILVDRGSYPTKKIAENSHRFRPLGLGYCNLGAYLMSNGIPYDSDEGRDIAAAITAIMSGEAYLQSALHAANLGAFEGFDENREPMLNVIDKHWNSVESIDDSCPEYLIDDASAAWALAFSQGEKHGYRNAQISVLAPTGTIAFFMDADTTGVEPDIALVKYKNLAGGGTMKIVNRTVRQALKSLGYDDKPRDQVMADGSIKRDGRPSVIDEIVNFVETTGSVEGLDVLDTEEEDAFRMESGLKPEHLPVFDCAFPPAQGGRSISWQGHVKMMAAVQPFISGAISKTVNMPKESTPQDIRDAYLEGWKLGLKALAIYRDGSKCSQPLSTSKEEKKGDSAADVVQIPVVNTTVPSRRRLPITRDSLTHKFEIQGHEGYLTAGKFPDGTPGELFATMAKEGSTVGGLMDTIGTLVSLGLQYGVPLEVLVEKFSHTRFEPSGMTRNPDIPFAKSITDYLFRWMGMEFLPGYREANAPNRSDTEIVSVSPPLPSQPDAAPAPRKAPSSLSEQFARMQSDAPPCDNCGTITVRSGACYRCHQCGNSMGCS